MVTGEESTRPRLNADSEIVSLFARPTCPKPQRFPIENLLGLYGTLSTEGPLLCGFSDQESGCFTYQILENNWALEKFDLFENRSHASSVNYNNSWIITGGQTYLDRVPIILDTSEILGNLSFTQGPDLPIPLSGHCSVNINDDQIFMSGGYGQPHLQNSFILNVKELSWEILPLMKYGKFGHVCGKLMTLFDEIEIIAVRGLHQYNIEKYSLVHSKWFTLPNVIEDQPIFKSATVQGKTTFIITGGVELEPDCKTSNCRIDSIKIYDQHINTLIMKNKRLSKGRGNHVATPIPPKMYCPGNNPIRCQQSSNVYTIIFITRKA